MPSDLGDFPIHCPSSKVNETSLETHLRPHKTLTGLPNEAVHIDRTDEQDETIPPVVTCPSTFPKTQCCCSRDEPLHIAPMTFFSTMTIMHWLIFFTIFDLLSITRLCSSQFLDTISYQLLFLALLTGLTLMMKLTRPLWLQGTSLLLDFSNIVLVYSTQTFVYYFSLLIYDYFVQSQLCVTFFRTFLFGPLNYMLVCLRYLFG
jgi:hypothetical protein